MRRAVYIAKWDVKLEFGQGAAPAADPCHHLWNRLYCL